MQSLFTGLVGQWLLRRALELGGVIGAAFLWFQALPPDQQSMLVTVLTGEWRAIPLGAVVGILFSLGGYIWSWISTMRPQVVVDNRQVPTKDLPAATKTVVEESARTAAAKKRPSLSERLKGLFTR